MKKTRRSALVIGGGIAGATAADRLSRGGLEVHLVEKRPAIGGRASEMGCKAAKVCTRCNVCVADEILRQVRASARSRGGRSNDARLRLHTSTELIELLPGRNNSRFTAVLGWNGVARLRIDVDAILIATGYEPFDPAENSAFNYGRLANVITGVEAERQLAKRQSIFRPSDEAVPKRIAFIQCVGSRTEETHRRPEDTNYCSTVCCSYALRMGRFIKHHTPESEVTFFHMDIQKFGKNFEKFYADCREEMRFIRARPYELRQGADQTVLVKYAAETGIASNPPPERPPLKIEPAGGVREEEFDLVVLSVGIRPPLGANSLADKLGVAIDEHGFFGLKGASSMSDLQREGIFAAGAAESPKDIAGCIAQAEAVSAVILESLKPVSAGVRRRGVNSDVIVIGAGIAGMQTSLSLARLGHETMLVHTDRELGGRAAAAPELFGHLGEDVEDAENRARNFIAWLVREVKKEKRITICSQTAVEKADGEQGAFSLTLKRGGKKRKIAAGAIVLATGSDCDAVQHGGFAVIQNIAGLLERMRAGDCGRRVALLMDAGGEHGRQAWGNALTAAEILSLRFGVSVKIYCRNARVAATGLESLYRRARAAGAMVVKFDRTPAVSERNGRAFVKYFDSVAGMELFEDFDMAVIVGREEWTQSAELFSRIAGLRPGPDGEAQSDNIWLLPGLTNRQGVFAIGSARGDSEYREALTDGLAAAQEIHALLSGDEIKARDDAAVVDAEKCVLCLTCLRVCPHGAISIDAKKGAALPSPISCKRCGTCVSECPARAISLPGFTDDDVVGKIGKKPRITVFACENSAMPAARAAKRKYGKGVNIIEVPCAGDVDPRAVLTALESGASKVLIIGCHPESCRYLAGSTRAERRIARIADMLAKAGYDGSRVSFHGISAVEPEKFRTLVNS